MALAKLFDQTKGIPKGITAALATNQDDDSYLGLDEQGFIASLKVSVRNWIPSLAKTYSRESAEALLTMVKKEFGSFVSQEVVDELRFERLLQIVRHVQISFAGFDHANKLKKKKVVDRVWCRTAEVGCAFKDNLKVILNPEQNELHLSLISNSGKTIGTVLLDVTTLKQSEPTSVKVWKESLLVGTVSLSLQSINSTGPYAIELTKARLNHALTKQLELVFKNYPNVQEAFHNFQPEKSTTDAGLVIKEVSVGEHPATGPEGATVILHEDKEHIFEKTLKNTNFVIILGQGAV